MTLDQVKENTITGIKEATDVDVSEDTIIPICGEWALAGSKLATCLVYDPDGEKQDRLEDAVEVLEKQPHISVPCGQGQSQRDAIKTLDPTDMVALIETFTGISHLKAR